MVCHEGALRVVEVELAEFGALGQRGLAALGAHAHLDRVRQRLADPDAQVSDSQFSFSKSRSLTVRFGLWKQFQRQSTPVWLSRTRSIVTRAS